MKNVLLVLQIIFSVFLIIIILVQSRGAGLNRAFAGGSVTSFTRRGLEKAIFKSTFIVSAIFLIISVLSLAL